MFESIISLNQGSLNRVSSNSLCRLNLRESYFLEYYPFDAQGGHFRLTTSGNGVSDSIAQCFFHEVKKSNQYLCKLFFFTPQKLRSQSFNFQFFSLCFNDSFPKLYFFYILESSVSYYFSYKSMWCVCSQYLANNLYTAVQLREKIHGLVSTNI